MITYEKLTDLPGWCFKVTDTGPGLPATLLARLRGEQIEQVEGEIVVATGRSGGEGIGLAIVTRLCRLLGTQLVVDSQPGEGTQFEIRFNDQHADEQ